MKKSIPNKAENYYKIIDTIISNDKITEGEVHEKIGVEKNELRKLVVEMKSFQYLKTTTHGNGSANNTFEVLPEGFSTYLTISSQKQAAEQARKATRFATWALGISILSFLASILFNILSLKS